MSTVVEPRQYYSLDPEQRRRRPAAVPLTFDNLTRPGPRFRETSGLVPLEMVATGDTQVFAARAARLNEPVLDLDPLATCPTVESVVASTEVRARRSLARLEFDSEADAVTIMAPAEADLIRAAAAIERLAQTKGTG